MRLFLIILLTVATVFSSMGQSCKKMYKDMLEPDAKLKDCGPNYTIEKTKSGAYVVKRYYPENKHITHLATYKSDKYKELHGRYERSWDDGTLVISGMYKDNVKVGLWQEERGQIGYYKNGEKEGEWKSYNKDSSLIGLNHYVHGELHGEQFRYDSLGQITLTEQYDNGELIYTSADTSEQVVEELPRFPGCEDMGLEGEELKACSDRELLQYVYGKLKYPKRSRELNIQGNALVEFVVEKDGSIADIKVLNGVSKDIKKVVVSLVHDMPTWRPGMQRGEPVRVLYTLPVSFRLE